MKMNKVHYKQLKAAITPSIEDKVSLYERGKFPRSDKVKDLNKRFRWDLLVENFSPIWISDNLYSYLNDVHIDTALRKIVPSITRKY